MSDLLVIHDLGAEGGRPWAVAFRDWEGSVVAPDLPGHGDAPAPIGGHRELGDAVFALVDYLRPTDEAQPIVIGVGRNGNTARILALAGRASALVLVDGLGGSWLDVPERNVVQRDIRRRILATPAALDPHVPGTTDLRTSWVLGPVDRDHVVEMLGAVPVPTLVVETPSSVTPDARDVAAAIPDHDLVSVRDDSAERVAAAVRAWVTTRSTVSPG